MQAIIGSLCCHSDFYTLRGWLSSYKLVFVIPIHPGAFSADSAISALIVVIYC